MPRTRAQAAKEAALLQEAQLHQHSDFSNTESQDSTLVDSETDSPRIPSDIGNEDAHVSTSQFSTLTASLDPQVAGEETQVEPVPEVELFSDTKTSPNVEDFLETQPTPDAATSTTVEKPKQTLIVVLKIGKSTLQGQPRRTSARLSARAKRDYSLFQSGPVSGESAGDGDFEISGSRAKRQKAKVENVENHSRNATQNIQTQATTGRMSVFQTADAKSNLQNVPKTSWEDSGLQSRMETRASKRLVLKLRLTDNPALEGTSEDTLEPSDQSGLLGLDDGMMQEDRWIDQSPEDEIKVLAQEKVRRTYLRPKGGYSNTYRFKIGFSPLGTDTPSAEECETIFSLLKEHHANMKDEKERIMLSRDEEQEVTVENMEAIQGPAHAGNGITFDALVKTIMAQATNNKSAIRVQQLLLEAYQYTDANGQKVVGTMPNYHDMRTGSFERLANVLKPAGLHRLRAGYIKGTLDVVFAANLARLTPAEQATAIQGNHAEAADYVPGLLSLDYLHDLKAKGTQALIDHLVSFVGIGVKTAGCIMQFNFKVPFFVVDAHVHRLTQWLGWVPRDCPRDKACAHLDTKVPNSLKEGLHQAFWHHGQLCLKCRAITTPEKTKGWDECVCPIERYLTRIKEPSRKRSLEKGSPDNSAGNRSGKPAPEKKAKDSRKPKAEPTMVPINKMSPEKAARLGYERKIFNLDIDDNFGVEHGNVRKNRDEFWMKIESHEINRANSDSGYSSAGDNDSNRLVNTITETMGTMTLLSNADGKNTIETEQTVQVSETMETTFEVGA